MTEPSEIVQAQLQAGLDLPQEKKLYFNGYTIAMTPTDIVLVLMFNNQPVATLNTSPTIAKTLGKVLDALIKDYETRTGQKVLTLDEITSSPGAT
ncbi:MAG: hypothetical protein HY872_00805 [Chloroflexi bacterium]|nr:hypothetical protein [Chloroflexota bacterium]